MILAYQVTCDTVGCEVGVKWRQWHHKRRKRAKNAHHHRLANLWGHSTQQCGQEGSSVLQQLCRKAGCSECRLSGGGANLRHVKRCKLRDTATRGQVIAHGGCLCPVTGEISAAQALFSAPFFRRVMCRLTLTFSPRDGTETIFIYETTLFYLNLGPQTTPIWSDISPGYRKVPQHEPYFGAVFTY